MWECVAYNGTAGTASGGDPAGALSSRMLACVPNIGPAQRRRRLFAGAVTFIGAALLALVLHDQSAIVRSLVFFPLYAAAIGFYQYREKT